MKILTVARINGKMGLSPVHYYRAVLPLQHLNKRKDIQATTITTETMFQAIKTGTTKRFENHDIYLLSRLHLQKGFKEFADFIHSWGGKVVYDTDDDLTDQHRHLGAGDDVSITASAADHVTVSTSYLARRMESVIGYMPTVLPNHIDFQGFANISLGAKRIDPGLTIGFIGTKTHYEDWKYPVKALRQLAEKYPDIRLGVAGYIPDYLRDLPNSIAMEPVPYKLYPRMMRQFDVVCCSLDPDDEFNRCKSAIKAIEAMSAARPLPNGKFGGAVPVCTDMPVYRRAVNKSNGLLVDNDSWYDALEMLIEDKATRYKLQVQGHKWTRKNRDIAQGYKRWHRVYKQLLNGGIRA